MNDRKPGLFSQQYRDIRGKVNRKLFKRFDAPWMKSKEYDIIRELVRNINPRYCLEWGSGYSTILIPPTIRDLKLWCSIEHDPAWYGELTDKINDDRVQVHLVEPDNLEFAKGETTLTEKKDGLYADFKSYVDFPGRLNLKFDYIFIDGRARRSCLVKAHELLSESGVVVVHDANRDIYFDNIPEYADTLRIIDYRKKRKLGGIWVGVKNGKVRDVLDVQFHQKVWNKNDRLARALFLR